MVVMKYRSLATVIQLMPSLVQLWDVVHLLTLILKLLPKRQALKNCVVRKQLVARLCTIVATLWTPKIRLHTMLGVLAPKALALLNQAQSRWVPVLLKLVRLVVSSIGSS